MLPIAVVFFPFPLKRPKKPCSKKNLFFEFVVLAYFFLGAAKSIQHIQRNRLRPFFILWIIPSVGQTIHRPKKLGNSLKMGFLALYPLDSPSLLEGVSGDENVFYPQAADLYTAFCALMIPSFYGQKIKRKNIFFAELFWCDFVICRIRMIKPDGCVAQLRSGMRQKNLRQITRRMTYGYPGFSRGPRVRSRQPEAFAPDHHRLDPGPALRLSWTHFYEAFILRSGI